MGTVRRVKRYDCRRSGFERLDVRGAARLRGASAGVGDQHGARPVFDVYRWPLAPDEQVRQATEHLPHRRNGLGKREWGAGEALDLVGPILLVVRQDLPPGRGDVDESRTSERIPAAAHRDQRGAAFELQRGAEVVLGALSMRGDRTAPDPADFATGERPN